jgi:SPP1 family phage portal protein
MQLFEFFKNRFNYALGRKQEFNELLAARDISAIRSSMQTRGDVAIEALKEYETSLHAVNNREPKIITNKKGNIKKREERWKLPIPYPVYINEIALVFMYGRPVKWTQQTENTDDAFTKYLQVIKRTRFNSKIRQAKRLAGAETESALLFRVFKDDDGQPDVQIRVLAKSKGDEIYYKFDQYENLISVAWGYYVKEANDKTVYHFDIFTNETTYRCTQRAIGWDVIEEINLIGKIPIILFHQEKEWQGVEPLIHREEMIASRSADTNDYFADPIAVLNADVVRNMPDKKEEAKTLIANGDKGVDQALKYVTWDNAPQSKKDELDWLQTQILSKSFTPNITLDTLKSISQLSAKALRTVMMLADIKASKRKETHDEMLDRTASLITAIIGNVLDVSLKSQCDEMIINHEFQEPFGEDVAETLDNIIKAVDGGILSTETAIELNPLVHNAITETERINKEKEEAAKLQQSIFGDAAGAGAQSFTDGDEDDDDEPDDKKKDKDQDKK